MLVKRCQYDQCNSLFEARSRKNKFCSVAHANASEKTGEKSNWWTGGNSRHPLYRTWSDILGRCYNPLHLRYKFYGGRGVTVCDRWKDNFLDFVADVGEKPAGAMLERINTAGDYEPGNVQWAEGGIQNINKRKLVAV